MSLFFRRVEHLACGVFPKLREGVLSLNKKNKKKQGYSCPCGNTFFWKKNDTKVIGEKLHQAVTQNLV